MFSSTIIPSIGRPELARAVQSLLDQTFSADDFEVIVVNDTGAPLPEADWQKSERVRIITTNRRERGVARNVGAAIAKGKFLHFLDDDDWLAPTALQTFWDLAQTNAAIWLYGSAQMVDSAGNNISILDLGMSGNCFAPAMAGEWIPTGAYLIENKAFFEIGGFEPLATPAEDASLCRRAALHGNFASTSTMVVYLDRGGHSSTNYELGLELSRRDRENVLNEAGVFKRLLASANSSYWYGQVLRVQLVSAAWNLQHKRLLTAISRTMHGLASFVLAGRYIFSPTYWQALTTSHVSRTRD